jgi:alpha-galactosidase
MNMTHAVPVTKPEDMSKSRAWAKQHFADSAQLPISFVLDEKVISGIPQEWQPVSVTRRIDANISETVFTGNDPKSGLHVRVECTEYHDYPVVEWVAWFTNQGQESTPLIRDILAMDGTFEGSAPRLVHCNGDFYSIEGYTPQEAPIAAGESLEFAPSGGRPCDQAFPYYRILFEEGGVSLAIGWPAQWSATFSGVDEGLQVRAGQQKTHLRLEPGESIRTPRMTALFWSGDVTRAINLWRRWYLAHILPRPNGQPLQPLMVCAAPDEGEEFTAATEENQIRYIDVFQQRDIHPDVWWIDAGWYPCYNQEHVRKWPITGTWEPDPERFPNGLKPISDHAARKGADLLIWFEPERVRPGTKLDREHPEWLLRIPESENGLLYLGNPECRQWLTDHYCNLIQENGIKIYRQDHNFPPLQHWRKNEADDRQGMNENLHVQGYLQFWDDLLARNPGLWIDSCASGGRRNDLETMRRSVPLHYTDYGYGDHPVKLAFHHTLLGWIPYIKEVTLSWDLGARDRFDQVVDSYSYHCGIGPMFFLTLDIRRDDYDYDLVRQMIPIWRRASGTMLFGDYYPLTPFHRSDQGWCVRQFDSTDTNQGFVQGIRFPASPDETFTAHLQAIQPEATYRFENVETGESKEIAGDDLMHSGFTFKLPPRSGAIWFYQRLDDPKSS